MDLSIMYVCMYVCMFGWENCDAFPADDMYVCASSAEGNH